MKCSICSNPATAGPDPLNPRRAYCIPCASKETLTIPATPEHLEPVPDAISQGPAWGIATPFSKGNQLWSHQARALHHLVEGHNTAISTTTASGKTLIFQLIPLDNLKRNNEGTTLIFYPTKALANDQLRRWQECCHTLELPPDTVGQIDGDVRPNSARTAIMGKAKIVLMTPDVAHAWLTRVATDPPMDRFLRNLRTIIIDEAHTYDSVFGSNSAYLFRRLLAATHAAGNPRTPQFIAATATIVNPAEHLYNLTGQHFKVVDQSDNGAPRHPRTIHHLTTPPKGDRESLLANLVRHIIDNDPTAQVIAFHDSRQGIERIVQLINRPETVLPYRSGYLAQDRRAIEDQLRDNKIQAVISTSALELGIDMPDLNHGINMDLPPTRKQFHQRLGRIGRNSPGTFVLYAPMNRFSAYGDTLKNYFDNSVEPSKLYLANEYITFQQAQCLKAELDSAGTDTHTPPETSQWPEGFDHALRSAHGRPPQHLAQASAKATRTAPQIAHSLRSAGEEHLAIIAPDPQRDIGSISMSMAMKEAYPGAIYNHNAQPYKVNDWRRNPHTKDPFIKVTPIRKTRTRSKTTPINRYLANIAINPDNIVEDHYSNTPIGCVATLKATITESVEGFIDEDGMVHYYKDINKQDPRKTRKQRDLPTTAVLIRIKEPWFTGDSGQPWQARNQLAHTLSRHLAYQQSIYIADIATATDNIFIQTPSGFHLLKDAIVIYDTIYGGLGLTSNLYEKLPQYAHNLTKAIGDSDYQSNLISPTNATRFRTWLSKHTDLPESPADVPTNDNWWRIISDGSRVRAFSPVKEEMTNGTILGHDWNNGVSYQVDTGHETITARDHNLNPITSNLDYQLWQPSTDKILDIETT